MSIFCTENNYRTNRNEHGEGHQGPVFYNIAPEACIPTPDTWTYCQWAGHQLFVQTELVIRFAKDFQNETIKHPADYIDSVTTGLRFIQVNVEDVENKNKVPWEKMHVWPGSFLTGEWFSTDFLADPTDVNFCLYNNREMAQLGNTENMIAPLSEVITHLCHAYPVRQGDILFTGAPPGVCELNPGDELEFFLEDETAGEFTIE